MNKGILKLIGWLWDNYPEEMMDWVTEELDMHETEAPHEPPHDKSDLD